MKIGIDAHVLTGRYQGSRTYLLHLLEAVGRRDHRNQYVLYSFDPAATRSRYPFPNFEHRQIALRARAPRLLFWWPWIQLHDRLDRLVTHYVSPLVFRRRQVLFVYDILYETHPRVFRRGFVLRNRLVTRVSARRARVVITLSDATRRALAAQYGIPLQRIVLAPPGIKPQPIEETRCPPAVEALRPYVLFVGRLEPRKNLPVLVEAFERLARSDLRLVLVGQEDFGCRDLMPRLRQHPRIVHLEAVDDEMLHHYYRQAALFVYPSLAEGFGIPVLEALSHGTPVVTADSTALPEAGGALARYVQVDGTDAPDLLATAMRAALDSGWRPAGAALQEHLARFTWERAAEAFLTALDVTE